MKDTISYEIDEHYCINHPNSSVKPTTCTTFHNTYKMYNYTNSIYKDVNVVDTDNDYLYKSVVLDEQTHQIYGFSPPKSVPNHFFSYDVSTTLPTSLRSSTALQAYEDSYNSVLSADKYLINEIVEGVMVNLWYDSFVQRWEISTKNAVGGLETLENKTILDMFLDAIQGHGQGDLHSRIQEMKCWKMAYSYHFVLQHPHMNVYPPQAIQPHHPISGLVNSPTLYLVAIYHIQKNIIKYIPPCCFQSWEELSFPWLLFPRMMPNNSEIQYSTLLTYYYSPYSEIYTTGAGIMITDLQTGVRTKIVSEVFKKYRELRSNNVQWLFQYLCLNHIQRVDNFLQYYPCFYNVFTQFQQQYIALIQHIHHSYMCKYIYRTKNRNQQFEQNIDYLHNEVFLKHKILDVQPKRIITLDVVKEYVDVLSPMYVMNLLYIGTQVPIRDIEKK